MYSIDVYPIIDTTWTQIDTNNTLLQPEGTGRHKRRQKRKRKIVVYNHYDVEKVMANLDLVKHIALYL